MKSRGLKANSRIGIYPVDISVFTERLKKIRALNCSPTDVGIETYGLKKLFFNKLEVLTRFV